ncbi:hypothetical protein M8494_22870 [Serratia ureilytica]
MIPSPKAAGMHRIEVLREGMESPVNLTITTTRLRLRQRTAHSPPPRCPAMNQRPQLPSLSTAPSAAHNSTPPLAGGEFAL